MNRMQLTVVNTFPTDGESVDLETTMHPRQHLSQHLRQRQRIQSGRPIKSRFLLGLLTLVMWSMMGFFGGMSAAHAAAPVNTLEKSGLFGKYKDSGIAIRGYDTVAYFTEGKAVEGSDEFQVEWNGATWKFSSLEHAGLFMKDPEAYAPQYGGYCAYGVSQNYLVKIEGDQWKIEEGKLYLNYDQGVQKTWLKDIPGFIELANSKIADLLPN